MRNGLFLTILLSFLCPVTLTSQTKDSLLGVKLRPEVLLLVTEVETKTGEKIDAEFIELPEFELGTSYISDDGVAVIRVDYKIEKDPKKLQAVIVHELLHLRLRVNGYPTFLFSPTVKTAKGLAQKVEQSNVNDVTSMIEHRIFESEMKKFGLFDVIDLAGDILRLAKRNKGREDEQSDTINYARAILEYQNVRDIEAVRAAYKSNGWERSLRSGRVLADIIRNPALKSPSDSEATFLRCVTELYLPQNASFVFTLTIDPSVKAYRQMIINIKKPPPVRVKRPNR